MTVSPTAKGAQREREGAEAEPDRAARPELLPRDVEPVGDLGLRQRQRADDGRHGLGAGVA